MKKAYFHNIVYDIAILRDLEINYCKAKLLKTSTEVKNAKSLKKTTLEQSVQSFLTSKKIKKNKKNKINPFVPNAPFLYPLKTSENLEGRERVHWEQMG